MKRLVIAATVLLAGYLLTTGCASQPQAEAEVERVSDQLAQGKARFGACLDRSKATGVWADVDEFLITRASDPRKIEKMATNRNANKEEKAALLKARATTQLCKQQAVIDMGQGHALAADYLARVFAGSDRRALLLIQNQITIGDYNEQVLESRLQEQQEWTGIWRQIVQDLETAHTAEVQQPQQAANASFKRWYSTQRSLKQALQHTGAMPTHTTTHCVYDRGSLNCRTE